MKNPLKLNNLKKWLLNKEYFVLPTMLILLFLLSAAPSQLTVTLAQEMEEQAEVGIVKNGDVYEGGREDDLTIAANEGYSFSVCFEAGELIGAKKKLSLVVDDDSTLVERFKQDRLDLMDGLVIAINNDAAPPEGYLLDADAGSDFIAVLYRRLETPNFFDGPQHHIYYNQLSFDGVWGQETLVAFSTKSTEGKLAVDNTNNIHVTYRIGNKLGYKKLDQFGWSNETLFESSTASGECIKPDIAVSSNSSAVHITYTDNYGTANWQKRIMYVTNTSGTFESTVRWAGSFKKGSYGGSDVYNIYDKGSFITVDANGYHYITTIRWNFIAGQFGGISEYFLRINSHSVKSITDVYGIYSGGNRIALIFKRLNQEVFRRASLSDGILGYETTIDVHSVKSIATDGSNIIVGGLSTNNQLLIELNGLITIFEEINVKDECVRVVNPSYGVFYVLYVDNYDGAIKIKKISSLLTVKSTNPATGVAISSSTGHGGTTQYTKILQNGNEIVLTAPEYYGSGAERKRFSSWSGAVSSNERTIDLTMSEDRTVTANYVDDPVIYSLNISSTNPGTGVAITSTTGHGGTTAYSHALFQDTIVTLTASEYYGSGLERKKFQNWTGAIESSSRTITLTMDAEKSVTANYIDDPAHYSLIVNSSNPTYGIEITSTTGHGGTTSYNRTLLHGTNVILTAPEYYGSGAERKRFSSWSGAVSSNERTIDLTVSEDRTVTANYVDDPVIYSLNISSTNPASGVSIKSDTSHGGTTPYSHTVAKGTSVNLTAMAGKGYEFLSWTEVGDVVSTEMQYIFTIDSDRNLTANFVKRPILTTEVASDISDDAATLNLSYTAGDYTSEVRFSYKKAADSNWTETAWVSNPGSPYGLVVTGLDSDTTYDFKAALKYNATVIEGDTLQFITGKVPPLMYTVTFGIESGAGTVFAIANGKMLTSGDQVEEGSDVIFTAVPDSGHQVQDWFIDGIKTGRSDQAYRLGGLQANIDVIVVFENKVTTDLKDILEDEYEDINIDNIVESTVNQGEETETYYYDALGGTNLLFALHWPGSTLRLSVYKPGGELYEAVEGDTPPIIILVNNADAGRWSYIITGLDVPESNYPYTAMVGSIPPVNLYPDPDPALATRYAGADRYETATKISQAGWPDGADTVVLANAQVFADALAGVSLAYQLEAPILITPASYLHKTTEAELVRLGASKVVILGGTVAISIAVREAVQALPNVQSVQRIAGADRYETAQRIAEKLFTLTGGFNVAFIANGITGWPDALAAASYAAQWGAPILLVHPQRLPYATKEALDSLRVENTIIIGGNEVIPDRIMNGLPGAERIVGPVGNRYETALSLARSFMPTNANRIFIATGTNFPDALAGGVLAAKEGSGVLLVSSNLNSLSNDYRAYIEAYGFNSAAIFGGDNAVNEALEKELEEMLQ